MDSVKGKLRFYKIDCNLNLNIKNKSWWEYLKCKINTLNAKSTAIFAK